jgi:hypothetical protein
MAMTCRFALVRRKKKLKPHKKTSALALRTGFQGYADWG